MTNEEVLKLIEDGRIIPIQIKANDEETSKYNLENLEALNMIIKALDQEPCEDCISRQAVLDLVVTNHTELNGVNVVMYSPFCKDIKQLSPVTPKEKTGRWGAELVEDEDWKGRKRRYYQPISCSECHKPNGVETKYCPNCGARMEGSE